MSTAGYDPEWVELEKALGHRPCFSGTVSDIRAQAAAIGEQVGPLFPPPTAEVEARDEKIDNHLTVRVYTPKRTTSGGGVVSKLPIGVFFHGGGFVLGNLEMEDADCRYFSQHANCIIVAVDYRVAPEVGFKDILQDCIDGFNWTWHKANSLGGDQGAMFVIGESAGGCFALQVANALISKDQGSQVRGVAALCPITAHPTSVPSQYREIYASYDEHATDVPFINKTVLQTFMEAAKLDPMNPTHFITLSTNISKFPPTFIVTAEKDPLRDDGVVLEKLLHDAGVKVKREHYDGFGHVFWNFPMLKKRGVFLADTVRGMEYILSA